MIYITGDTHRDANRFCDANMPGQSGWTKDDKLIVCGDFGYVWHDEDEKDAPLLDALAEKPYEILFVDGNHENFNRLEKFDEEERYGGKVHKIRDNIYHLQRGYVYTIDGYTFFAFGGAYSIDKAYREPDVGWWSREMPSEEEYERAERSLAAVGHQVDFIITHTAPQFILEACRPYVPLWQRGFRLHPEEFALSSYLGKVEHDVTFSHWYFGHWHWDIKLPHATALLFDVVAIPEKI